MDSTSPSQPSESSSSVPTPKGSGASFFGAIGVVVVAAIAYFATQGGNKPVSETPKPTKETATENDDVSEVGETPDEVAIDANPNSKTGATYRDGTYDVKGSYQSPAGPEQIDVKVTLKTNVITDATVTGLATNKKSVFMQGKFVEGYKPLVIGKNIEDVVLSKVSGSSLTPIGWNDAIAKIKAQSQI